MAHVRSLLCSKDVRNGSICVVGIRPKTGPWPDGPERTLPTSARGDLRTSPTWLFLMLKLVLDVPMTKSQWLAFVAYTVILLAAAATDATTELPRWGIGLVAVLSIAVVGGLLSFKGRQ